MMDGEEQENKSAFLDAISTIGGCEEHKAALDWIGQMTMIQLSTGKPYRELLTEAMGDLAAKYGVPKFDGDVVELLKDHWPGQE